MRFDSNPFGKLANQASTGDGSAKAQLGRELEPQLMYIVRRALQKGARASALDRRILAEADKIGLDADGADGPDGEFLIRQVARSVCSLVLAGVSATTHQRSVLEDTVCS